jgi:hypothetical protein
MLQPDVEMQNVLAKVTASQINLHGEHIQTSNHLTITSFKIQVVAFTEVYLKKRGKRNRKERNGVSGFGMAKIMMELENISVLNQAATQTNFLLQHSVQLASMIKLNPSRSVKMLSLMFIKIHTMDLVADGQSEAQHKLTTTLLMMYSQP